MYLIINMIYITQWALCYVSVTDCYDALYVDDSKGFLIVGSTFEGSNYGIWGKDNTKYELLSCTLKGGNKAISIKNGAAKLLNCKVLGEKNRFFLTLRG